jgi:hypothetical protein
MNHVQAWTWQSKDKHDKPYFQHQIPFACSLDGTVKGNGKDIMTDIKKGDCCVNADSIAWKVGVIEAKLTAHDVESANRTSTVSWAITIANADGHTYGAKWGAVCVLYKGTTLKVFVYQRDEEVIARMHEASQDFQRRLDKYKNNDEVEWYDIQDTREAASIFDEAEKTEIDLSDKADHVNKDYRNTRHD